MSWGSHPFVDIWGAFWGLGWQFYLPSPFASEGVCGSFRGKDVPLSCVAAHIIQRNWIFPHLWPLVLTPVAEICRLCKPLPGRSHFCPGDWQAWLFLRDGGYAWTWYWVTAWHPMFFPLAFVEEAKDPSWETLVHREQWFRICRRCCGLLHCRAQLIRDNEGVLSVQSWGILESWIGFSSLAFPPFLFSSVSATS